MTQKYHAINFMDKFSKFNETWTPKILGRFDDYYLKAAKMAGEFVWHSHKDADELFIVVSGTLKIMFRDGDVMLSAGDCFIVPRGIEHKPVADGNVCCLLIEKAGTLNTGDQGGDKTVSDEEWL
ncbi:MAG: cupin domain-containing protein [Alphaproteobacteria bacterium]|nr:cupin domain-containing protein [Alphaproteobacteria bacterium]